MFGKNVRVRFGDYVYEVFVFCTPQTCVNELKERAHEILRRQTALNAF